MNNSHANGNCQANVASIDLEAQIKPTTSQAPTTMPKKTQVEVDRMILQVLPSWEEDGKL